MRKSWHIIAGAAVLSMALTACGASAKTEEKPSTKPATTTTPAPAAQKLSGKATLMNTVTSKDGTVIAFDKTGQGPALIVVDGALCYRALGPSGPLAAQLAQHFTVYTYDRRGRGDSGNTLPYAPEREVEDIEALINAAGGSAFVYADSSGVVLALEAANRLPAIKKLVLYEPPFIVDGSQPPDPDWLPQTKELIASDRRGDAVKLFLKHVGVPAVFRTIMPLTPGWSKLKAISHTIPYDLALMADYGKGKPLPAGRWTSVTAPTLVMAGGKSPAFMRTGAKALADILPTAQYRTLPGQTHEIKPEAQAPVLVEFFKE